MGPTRDREIDTAMTGRHRGFTLIEALVGLVLVVLIVLPILALVASTCRGASLSRRHVEAHLIGRHALASLAALPYGELVRLSREQTRPIRISADGRIAADDARPGPGPAQEPEREVEPTIEARIVDAGGLAVPGSTIPALLALSVTIRWPAPAGAHPEVSLARLVAPPYASFCASPGRTR
jgi:hypothetical protein